LDLPANPSIRALRFFESWVIIESSWQQAVPLESTDVLYKRPEFLKANAKANSEGLGQLAKRLNLPSGIVFSLKTRHARLLCPEQFGQFFLT